MRLAVTLPTYANDGMRVPADRIVSYARRAEELGFSGAFATEHLLRPPGREYSRLDPLTTLATVAGATDSIPVGTCVMIPPMRDPVLLAKRVATLQHLAEDRLQLGMGLGWVEAEYDAVSVPFEERGPRFSEGLELLSRLFAEEVVTFEGEFYSVEEFRLEPPTRQTPTMLVAGGGVREDDPVPEPAAERILRHGDGWLAPPARPEFLEDVWEDIAEHVREGGRDPESVSKAVLNFTHLVPGVDGETARRHQREVFRGKGSVERAMANSLTGSVEEIRETVRGYADAGYDRLILGLRTDDLAEVDRQLELWADHLGEFL